MYFPQIYAQQHFVYDISAKQNFKISEIKHFVKIINYDFFQCPKIILRFILSKVTWATTGNCSSRLIKTMQLPIVWSIETFVYFALALGELNKWK